MADESTATSPAPAPPAPPESLPALALPRRTTPTWEMELLLSGATVFALFQAVQAIPAAIVYLMPRLGGDWTLSVSVLMIYGHGALLLLVLAFALHLVLRAYWVALVGMNSVFPGDLDLQRMRAGPLTRALVQRHWVDMDTTIERADNRATIVFALGVSIAVVLVPVSITVTGLFAVSALLASQFGLDEHTVEVYAVLAGGLLLPYFAADLLDRYRGERLRPGSWLQRACAATLAAYARIGLRRDFSQLLTLFATNVGERKGSALFVGIMLAALFGSLASLAGSRMELGPDGSGVFPALRGLERAVDGRHYADSQEPGRSPLLPFIPGKIVHGDYLTLVVPLLPTMHGDLLRRCAAADAGAGAASDVSGDAAADAVAADADNASAHRAQLACLQAGVTLQLDGAPLALAPDWYTEPDHDLRGLLYMVDARPLAAGRHELALIVAADADRKDEVEARRPYRIPFWR